MISTIIFSKDRACQLDLLLNSISKNCPYLFDLTIIYSASDDSFQRGYDKLKRKDWDINWVGQESPPSDFREITLSQMDKAGDYLCFFVDDNIVYRKFNCDQQTVESIFDCGYDLCCLSLRLGTNTLIQNEYRGTQSPTPDEVAVFNDEYIIWGCESLPEHTNFAYPFSVDGHIYKKQTVLDIVDYDFDTPNGFEGRGKREGMPKFMSCPIESVVVNSPINLVGSSQNSAGLKYGVPLEELNDMFLSGRAIDLDSMDFSGVRGCHQEIQYKFTGEVTC